ncbi:DUF5343 domain-containing protein [Oceaniradius stylonematis]|uniref:DUF5343 domain-containing protein n=1 Tax=Oceaniradius stylonematis TaxID=2184161 RepID=UPI00273F3BB4|nr:DUF5343 domain-containing protein [Oceaniradius stylonematis]
MALPNSYTIKTGAIPDYFEAILNAEAPDRFSQKFLEGLGFASSNDRLFIGILKELGFLNADGAPQERYYSFLDRSISQRVLAEGIREAYADLFAVNTSADKMTVDDAYNKLRTLYKGDKKDTVIKNIAKTFVALSNYADFRPVQRPSNEKDEDQNEKAKEAPPPKGMDDDNASPKRLDVRSLQYHINIVLPDTRDQAVFDAIFKSMRDHLG